MTDAAQTATPPTPNSWVHMMPIPDDRDPADLLQRAVEAWRKSAAAGWLEPVGAAVSELVTSPIRMFDPNTNEPLPRRAWKISGEVRPREVPVPQPEELSVFQSPPAGGPTSRTSQSRWTPVGAKWGAAARALNGRLHPAYERAAQAVTDAIDAGREPLSDWRESLRAVASELDRIVQRDEHPDAVMRARLAMHDLVGVWLTAEQVEALYLDLYPKGSE